MRLDATDLRYLPPDAFAVLKAIERGSLSHEVVPTSFIARAYASSSGAGLAKIISSLAKLRLIARVQGASYEGWRLSYGGYDWLAVKALSGMDVLHAVGQRVGVGKESDIYIAVSPSHDIPLPLPSTSVMAASQPLPKLTLEESAPLVLKVHRLGRISFRKIKEKRDYLGKRRNDLGNWMFLSRLSAKREWEFLLLLHAYGFPVPTPIAYSRHAIIMSFIVDSHPLYQIRSLPTSQLGLLFDKLMQLIVRLAKHGLVHGDFNEFNILIKRRDEGEEDEYEVDPRDKRTRTAWVRGEKQEEREEGEERRDLSLKEGERIEEGKGFVRIVAGEAGADVAAVQDQQNDGESDEEEEEEEEEDDYDSEEDAEAQGKDAKADVDFGEDEAMLEPILIDFPQMVSIEHPNAEEFFNRDVECMRTFFLRRFRFETSSYPSFAETVGDLEKRRWERRKRAREEKDRKQGRRIPKDAAKVAPTGEEGGEEEEMAQLDVIGNASGVGGGKVEDELSRYIHGMRIGGDQAGERSGEEEEGAEDEEEEEEEEEEEAENDGDEADPSEPEAKSSRRTNKSSSKVSSKDTSSLPSRGAALKALKEGDDSLIKQRLAAEMARKEASSRKHHGGKKSKGGKMGRAQAGSKAKMGEKAVVQGSLEF